MGRIGYIEPVIFLYTLMLYLNVPIEKQMIYQKVCLSHYNESFCRTIRIPFLNHTHEENRVQGETVQWDMINNIIRTIPTIVSTMFLGAWSDGVGRKRVLLVPVCGEAVNAVSYFLNAWFMRLPVPFMFIGSIVTGLCGNFPAVLMVVFAYMADVTTADKRTMRLIILDALVFLSSIISLFTGGFLLQTHGFVAVYGLDLALISVMIVYIIFLRESYYPDNRVSIKHTCTGGEMKEYIKLLTQKPSLYYRPKLLLLSGSFCALFFATTGISEMLVHYLMHTPLSFPPTSIGYVLAAESSAKFLGAIVITVVFVSKFQWMDSSLVLLCSFTAAGYGLCLGLSKVHWAVYVSTLWGLGVCAGIAACRSGLSKLVSMEEQGKLNSLVCTLQEIMLLLVALVCNNIYTATVRMTPSFVMYVLACVSVIPILLSLILKYYDRRENVIKKIEDDLNRN